MLLAPLVFDDGCVALFFVLERQTLWQQRGSQISVVIIAFTIIFVCSGKGRIELQQWPARHVIISVAVAVSPCGVILGRRNRDLRPATDATKKQRATAVVASWYHCGVETVYWCLR